MGYTYKCDNIITFTKIHLTTKGTTEDSGHASRYTNNLSTNSLVVVQMKVGHNFNLPRVDRGIARK